MKKILVLLLIILSHFAKANTYYLSAAAGDDDRSPLQAQHPSTPWKTINKLNSFFSKLQPGDSVLFKSGETFYGSINVTRSGVANLPLVISFYGKGNKPVITGLTLLTWTSSGNNIYESQELGVSAINLLTVNGIVTPMGRYPNSNMPNKGYLKIESHDGTNSITDNQLASTPNWTGADLVIRTRKWMVDRDKITNHSGSTIYYTASSKNAPGDGFGYFIQNSIATLDQPGEWYFNPATNKVSMYNTSLPKDVKAATLDNLVNESSQSYITFDNLVFEGANTTAINITGGSNIIVQNSDILSAGQNGVKTNNHSNFKIENSSVLNSFNNGIDIGNKSNYSIAKNNLVKNTYVFTGMGSASGSKGYGITTNSRGTIIEYNKVINTGYIGINFSDKDSIIIRNNYIDSFCVTTNDGSGIYTYSGAKATINRDRKVIGNIVMNGIGVSEGTNDKSDLAAEGIYMDLNSNGVEIDSNTVVNCTRGLFLQKGTSVIVKNNTFYNNKYQFYDQANSSEPNANNTIAYNIFFSKLSTQAISRSKNKNDINLFGASDENFYAGVQNNKLVVYNKLQALVNAPVKNNMADPKDKLNYTRFEYNASTKSKTINLDGDYVDIKNNRYSNNVVLPPYTSLVLIKEK